MSFGTVAICSLTLKKPVELLTEIRKIEHFFLQFYPFFNFRISEEVEFQAIVVIGFKFSNITNKPNKSTVIKKLMATCSFYREIALSVGLRIRRDTRAKCMFSSFPVFRITNGAFSGILRFIALCRDRQYAE